MGAEPFNTLTEWYGDEMPVTLLIDDLVPVPDCLLRECSLDLDQQRLYVQIYTKHSDQEVRHWFNDPADSTI